MHYYDDNYDKYELTSISELTGKTVTEITGMKPESKEIKIKCSDGSEFIMCHDQECCEYVRIEDVCGNVDDLIGSPITLAEERINDGGKNEEGDHMTWTFYALATVKGYVDLRWLGESNGYYSERADIYKRKENIS